MLSRKLLSTLVLGSLMSGCASLPTQHSEVMSRGGQRSGGFTANLVVEPSQNNEGSINQSNQNNSLDSAPDTYPTSAPGISSRGPRGPVQPPPAPHNASGSYNQTATLQQANVIAQGLSAGGNGQPTGSRINVVWQPSQNNTGSIDQENQNNSLGEKDRGKPDGLTSQPEPGNMVNGGGSTSAYNQSATLQQANVIIQDSTLPNQQNRNTTRSNRGSRR